MFGISLLKLCPSSQSVVLIYLAFFPKILNLLNDSCGVSGVTSLIHMNNGALKKNELVFSGNSSIHHSLHIAHGLVKDPLIATTARYLFPTPRFVRSQCRIRVALEWGVVSTVRVVPHFWDQGVIIYLLPRKLYRRISKTFLLTCVILSSFLSLVMNRI